MGPMMRRREKIVISNKDDQIRPAGGHQNSSKSRQTGLQSSNVIEIEGQKKLDTSTSIPLNFEQRAEPFSMLPISTSSNLNLILRRQNKHRRCIWFKSRLNGKRWLCKLLALVILIKLMQDIECELEFELPSTRDQQLTNEDPSKLIEYLVGLQQPPLEADKSLPLVQEANSQLLLDFQQYQHQQQQQEQQAMDWHTDNRLSLAGDSSGSARGGDMEDSSGINPTDELDSHSSASEPAPVTQGSINVPQQTVAAGNEQQQQPQRLTGSEMNSLLGSSVSQASGASGTNLGGALMSSVSNAILGQPQVSRPPVRVNQRRPTYGGFLVGQNGFNFHYDESNNSFNGYIPLPDKPSFQNATPFLIAALKTVPIKLGSIGWKLLQLLAWKKVYQTHHPKSGEIIFEQEIHEKEPHKSHHHHGHHMKSYGKTFMGVDIDSAASQTSTGSSRKYRSLTGSRPRSPQQHSSATTSTSERQVGAERPEQSERTEKQERAPEKTDKQTVERPISSQQQQVAPPGPLVYHTAPGWPMMVDGPPIGLHSRHPLNALASHTHLMQGPQYPASTAAAAAAAATAAALQSQWLHQYAADLAATDEQEGVTSPESTKQDQQQQQLTQSGQSSQSSQAGQLSQASHSSQQQPVASQSSRGVAQSSIQAATQALIAASPKVLQSSRLRRGPDGNWFAMPAHVLTGPTRTGSAIASLGNGRHIRVHPSSSVSGGIGETGDHFQQAIATGLMYQSLFDSGPALAVQNSVKLAPFMTGSPIESSNAALMASASHSPIFSFSQPGEGEFGKSQALMDTYEPDESQVSSSLAADSGSQLLETGSGGGEQFADFDDQLNSRYLTPTGNAFHGGGSNRLVLK